MKVPQHERLVDLRRAFHRHPEPAWREFQTTIRLVEEVERIGVDELYVGPEAIDPEARLGVPPEDERQRWYDRAAESTDRPELLRSLKGGNTGLVAVLERGAGPTVGLRVDIDGLPITESSDPDHRPVAEGFRSEHPESMHACGHDAHMTFGLGVLQTIAESDLCGTFKFFFQPAEEVIGGGKPMSASGHLDDVRNLFGVHIGLGHPSGTVVSGFDKPLAISQLEVAYEGESAHAGLAPNQGRNAVHALVTGVDHLYGIPRHESGATRVNVGELHSPNASNVIADRASASVELRGETTELMEYMRTAALRVLERAGDIHDCTFTSSLTGEAPRVDSDDALSDIVAAAAEGVEGVTSIRQRTPFGASEDFTYLMRRVQDGGGESTFVGIGTDHPGGHHTPRFDIDERSLSVGVRVLANAVASVADGS